MGFVLRFSISVIFLIFFSCAKTPKEVFKDFVLAVQKGDIKRISRLDYGLANKLKDMFKVEQENFLKSLGEEFDLPATTASIESYRGFPPFGVKSCQYAPKVFFPPDAKVEVIDMIEKEEYGEKLAFLQVSVTYPEGKEPYYIEDVEVIWYEPKTPRGGIYIPPIKPIPMFYPGFFEYNHPFRNNPKFFARYNDYNLSLTLKEVKKAMLKVEMIYDPKEKRWFFKDLFPDLLKSEYKK